MKRKMILVKRWSFLVFSVIFLLAATTTLAFGSGTVDEEFETINGIPLKITAGSKGTLDVKVNDTMQYCGDRSCGSALIMDYGNAALQQKFVSPYIKNWAADSDIVFTPVSIVKASDFEINAVFDAGESGLRVSQKIVYVNGEKYYKKTWSISNEGTKTYSDLRFFHGGDTYFGGIDSSNGHYDDNLKMVYLTNPDPNIDGIMGFYAHPSSPSSHYQEGNYYGVITSMIAGLLPDSVNPGYHDAGYALQWDRASLAPGETWTITAFEKWTEAGFAQVIAPAGQVASANVTIAYDFSILNLQDSTDVFDFNAVSSKGWAATVDQSFTSVAAYSSANVRVNLVVPADAVDADTDTLTLTAVSQSDADVKNSDSVTTTVSRKDNGGGGGSSGCNAGMAPFALLLITPLFFFKRKK